MDARPGIENLCCLNSECKSYGLTGGGNLRLRKVYGAEYLALVGPGPHITRGLVSRFWLAGVEVVAASRQQTPVAIETTTHGQRLGPMVYAPLTRHQRAIARVAQQLGDGDIVAGKQPAARQHLNRSSRGRRP